MGSPPGLPALAAARGGVLALTNDLGAMETLFTRLLPGGTERPWHERRALIVPRRGESDGIRI
jgi:hypothetical protein